MHCCTFDKGGGIKHCKQYDIPSFHNIGYFRVNDPSAGSPTETLLRLLLPLSDKVYLTSRTSLEDSRSPEGSPDHSKSVGATGGVYKGQGRNQHKLMTRAY